MVRFVWVPWMEMGPRQNPGEPVGGPLPETNSWHKHMKNGWLLQTIVSGNVYNLLRGELAVSFRE